MLLSKQTINLIVGGNLGPENKEFPTFPDPQVFYPDCKVGHYLPGA